MSTSGDGEAWAALTTELDTWADAGLTATFWWRDDDAGPADPALERLLALARASGVPVGLAVVPEWLSPETAAVLRQSPASVGLMQHGFAHANHETTIPPGQRKVKPAECGAARPPAVVLAEVVEGRRTLQDAFGARVLPVLVPPWNRIAPAVREALPGAGYRALSTFGPRSAAERVPGLHQVNCHADPIVWREARRFVGPAATLERLRAHLEARRDGRADPDEPTGLLTHHRDLSPELWAFLPEWLGRLGAHAAVAFPPLARVFALDAHSDTR